MFGDVGAADASRRSRTFVARSLRPQFNLIESSTVREFPKSSKFRHTRKRVNFAANNVVAVPAPNGRVIPPNLVHITRTMSEPDTKFGDMEPVDPLIGQTISSDYEVLELIGAGGWSRVYKAREKDGERIVAFKVLHSHLLFDRESVTRFEREAKSGVSLSHPNICQVFDYDRLESGQPYIIMEYLKGESLASLLKRKGKLSEKDAVPVFIACLNGLQEAHDNGIVHRDVKPANIFILDAEQSANGSSVKLLDFGMAKIIVGVQPDLTLTGTAFGTVQYMSPEQVLGKQIDGRSDLYALGCVMYETLTGKKVFEGATAFGVMEQHVRTPVRKFRDVDPSTSVSPQLEAIVMKALSKSGEERFQTAKELADALTHKEEFAVPKSTDGDVQSSVNSLVDHPSNSWIPSKSHAMIIAIASVVLAVALGLILTR